MCSEPVLWNTVISTRGILLRGIDLTRAFMIQKSA